MTYTNIQRQLATSTDRAHNIFCRYHFAFKGKQLQSIVFCEFFVMESPNAACTNEVNSAENKIKVTKTNDKFISIHSTAFR